MRSKLMLTLKALLVFSLLLSAINLRIDRVRKNSSNDNFYKAYIRSLFSFKLTIFPPGVIYISFVPRCSFVCVIPRLMMKNFLIKILIMLVVMFKKSKKLNLMCSSRVVNFRNISTYYWTPLFSTF